MKVSRGLFLLKQLPNVRNSSSGPTKPFKILNKHVGGRILLVFI